MAGRNIMFMYQKKFRFCFRVSARGSKDTYLGGCVDVEEEIQNKCKKGLSSVGKHITCTHTQLSYNFQIPEVYIYK